MGLRKVPPSEWAGVLDRFSREHRAWLATVFELRGDLQASCVEERPLRSVDLEAPPCVAIRFADDTPQVRVEAPRVLRIDDKGLAIESAQGTTRLRFRVAPRPETLDGLAPGERYSGGSTGSPGAGS